MNVLITSGPTREPIDDVRFVSNVSTGRLGVRIASAFVERGHDVVLARGIGSAPAPSHPRLESIEFSSAASLLQVIESVLARSGPNGGVDLLIHAAAVADYAPVPVAGKIKSTEPALTVHMRPTPKVVDQIRMRHPTLDVILFKLESDVPRDELHARARRAARRVGARAVVANLLGEVSANEHAADLLSGDGRVTSLVGKGGIAMGLVAEAERIVADGRPGGATWDAS